MSHLPPHTFSLNPPAAEPSKDGPAASRVTVAQIRRVRVPTPPPLSAKERRRALLMIEAASSTESRVLVILVEIAGFTIVDAAAVVGLSSRDAIEQLKALGRLASAKLGFDTKAESNAKLKWTRFKS